MAKKTDKPNETTTSLLDSQVRLRVNRQDLSGVMGHMQKIGGGSGTLPALHNVYLEATPDGLVIMRTNLESTLRMFVPCQPPAQPWRAMVDAKILGDFLRELAAEEVELVLGETAVLVDAGKLRGTIRGGNPDDYPRPGADEGDPLAEMDAGDLGRLLESVCYAANTSDAGGPVQMGVHLVWHDGQVVATATDGHRLARRKMACRTRQTLPVEQIVPAAALRRLAGFLRGARSDQPVVITANMHHIYFNWGQGLLIITQAKGKYPAVDGVIPANYAVQVVVNRAALERAQRLATPFTDGDANGIALALDGGEMVISSTEPQTGDQATRVPAAATGDAPLKVLLHARFLKDAIAAMGTNEITLGANLPQQPVGVWAHGTDEGFGLIMPMYRGE